MTHSWCRDIPRDEAVRAAEDGRSVPLPTLEEAISGVTERRPVDAGGGGNVTGLRVAYGQAVVDRLADERDAAIRERDTLRARVAELESAAKLAPAANADGGSNHAAPAASGAAGTGVAEIARRAFDAGFGSSREGFNGECAHDHLAPKESTFEGDGSEPYERLKRDSVAKIMSEAAPQPATGWLTAEERETLMRISHSLDYVHFFTSANFIRSFLARSSPPEVVPPEQEFRSHSNALRDAEWFAALAAAGVPVKEVGSE